MIPWEPCARVRVVFSHVRSVRMHSHTSCSGVSCSLRDYLHDRLP